jgi:hypothetical protein
MMRFVAFGSLLLCLAAVSSCAIGIDRVFMPAKAEQDARIILQGMRSVPLRDGDAPVDIQAE